MVILELQVTDHPAAGLATAFGRIFWWAVAFTALGALPVLLLGPASRRPQASEHWLPREMCVSRHGLASLTRAVERTLRERHESRSEEGQCPELHRRAAG
jgi:hypothetical protein